MGAARGGVGESVGDNGCGARVKDAGDILWAWMFPLGGTSLSVLKLQLDFCSSFCMFVLILAC